MSCVGENELVVRKKEEKEKEVALTDGKRLPRRKEGAPSNLESNNLSCSGGSSSSSKSCGDANLRCGGSTSSSKSCGDANLRCGGSTSRLCPREPSPPPFIRSPPSPPSSFSPSPPPSFPPSPPSPPPSFSPSPPLSPPSPSSSFSPSFSPSHSKNDANPPNHGFAPLEPPHPFPRPKGRRFRVRIIIAIFALMLGLGFILFLFWWKRKKTKQDIPVFHVSVGDEFGNGLGPREFSFDELSKATNNFADEEKLGEGGFGAVYKGVLRDSNTNVAVKRISRKSKQGIKEYKSEVKIISQLRHKNLVKLIGWCHERELLLAYEFMPSGSLDFHLFKGRSVLPWKIRYKIVQGLASALLYLHEEGDLCVLHRDIKASNIMLDSVFDAKLGDFGLARLVDHDKGSQTTLLAGTLGYIAPECYRTGKASKDSDIYSFGIVALEIACGRRSIESLYDEHQASLVAWVWEAYGNQMLLDVADKKLFEDFNVKEMEHLLLVGLWCAHPSRSMRPSIRQAMQVLNFEAAPPNLLSKMPVPNYDDIPSTSIIRISEPGSLSITIPR